MENKLDQLLEQVSARVHEAWMKTRRSKGVTTRLSESGEELMVPYEQLSEAAKDLDRRSLRTVLDALVRVVDLSNVSLCVH